jgi:Protein of unknown function (DUF2946)
MSRGDAISMRNAAFGGRSRMGAVAARRRRLQSWLPIALLALLLQLAAPIGAAWFAAAAFADPLRTSEICHSDPDAAPAPTNQGGDQHACAVDCLICCVLHAGGVLDAPRAPVLVVPRLAMRRIAWSGTALILVHAQAGSNAQARAPPLLS